MFFGGFGERPKFTLAGFSNVTNPSFKAEKSVKIYTLLKMCKVKCPLITGTDWE